MWGYETYRKFRMHYGSVVKFHAWISDSGEHYGYETLEEANKHINDGGWVMISDINHEQIDSYLDGKLMSTRKLVK